MKVKNVINYLKQFNPDAKIRIVAHNKIEEFTITWGNLDGEGTSKEKTTEVHFYVDRLCSSENES